MIKIIIPITNTSSKYFQIYLNHSLYDIFIYERPATKRILVGIIIITIPCKTWIIIPYKEYIVVSVTNVVIGVARVTAKLD